MIGVTKKQLGVDIKRLEDMLTAANNANANLLKRASEYKATIDSQTEDLRGTPGEVVLNAQKTLLKDLFGDL